MKFVKFQLDTQFLIVVGVIIFFCFLLFLNRSKNIESYQDPTFVKHMLESIKKELIRDLTCMKNTNPSLFDDASFKNLVSQIKVSNKKQLIEYIVNGFACLCSGQSHAVRPGNPGAPKVMI